MTAELLTSEEAALIASYRRCDALGKAHVLATTDLLSNYATSGDQRSAQR